MKVLFRTFSDSAREFRSIKSVVTAALLLALHTVLACFVSIQVTESLRISISFLTNIVTGCLFGPVMGLVCGGLGDIIQFVIKPTGPYFIGWTINAALAGLIYGLFFYNRYPSKNIKFRANIEDAGVTKKTSILYRGLTIVIPLVAIMSLMAAPFARVNDKATGELVASGSAMELIKGFFTGNSAHNIAIIAMILAVLSIILLIVNIWDLHTLPLMASIFGSFASILAIYTDKKTTSVEWGFVLAVLLIILYAAVQVVILSKKHSVDLKFLAICIFALAFDTVLVNIFLGTYWVTTMYGKGFAFYFTSRLIKNLVQMPINIILTYYVLGFIKDIKKYIK